MDKGHFIRFWLPVVLWMIFIFYMSSLEFPEKPKVNVGGQKFKVSDILLHVAEYGMLSILLFRAFHNASERTRQRALLLALIIASFYGVIDEVHQVFVPTRYFEIKDIFSNMVGSSIVTITRNVRILLL